MLFKGRGAITYERSIKTDDIQINKHNAQHLGVQIDDKITRKKHIVHKTECKGLRYTLQRSKSFEYGESIFCLLLILS